MTWGSTISTPEGRYYVILPIYIHGSRLFRLWVYWVTRAQWDWDVRGWWKRGSSTWVEGPPCPHRIFFCLDFESRNVPKLCAHQTASSLVRIQHFAFCTVSVSVEILNFGGRTILSRFALQALVEILHLASSLFRILQIVAILRLA